MQIDSDMTIADRLYNNILQLLWRFLYLCTSLTHPYTYGSGVKMLENNLQIKLLMTLGDFKMIEFHTNFKEISVFLDLELTLPCPE